MENIVLDGKMVNLASLPIEKLKKTLKKIDEEEFKIKQEIDQILENLT